MSKTEYFIIDRSALPEVYGQVIEAKKLIAGGKAATVQEAVDMVGISRSSFYKYKDVVEPFNDMVRHKTVTFTAQLEDHPGVLAQFLLVLEKAKVNILTIHQAIPIGGVANVTLSIDLLEDSWTIEDIVESLSKVEGSTHIRVLARN
ncbi:MAG: ACT domain-containing protein [Firmicutes bacterium]|nr:ACT domain-containing protein [Bacillota bacterium]